MQIFFFFVTIMIGNGCDGSVVISVEIDINCS